MSVCCKNPQGQSTILPFITSKFFVVCGQRSEYLSILEQVVPPGQILTNLLRNSLKGTLAGKEKFGHKIPKKWHKYQT